MCTHENLLKCKYLKVWVWDVWGEGRTDRCGAGISKVVRPLKIKDHDHLCMCTGGGLQQAMCGSKKYLWNQNA